MSRRPDLVAFSSKKLVPQSGQRAKDSILGMRAAGDPRANFVVQHKGRSITFFCFRSLSDFVEWNLAQAPAHRLCLEVLFATNNVAAYFDVELERDKCEAAGFEFPSDERFLREAVELILAFLRRVLTPEAFDELGVSSESLLVSSAHREGIKKSLHVVVHCLHYEDAGQRRAFSEKLLLNPAATDRGAAKFGVGVLDPAPYSGKEPRRSTQLWRMLFQRKNNKPHTELVPVTEVPADEAGGAPALPLAPWPEGLAEQLDWSSVQHPRVKKPASRPILECLCPEFASAFSSRVPTKRDRPKGGPERAKKKKLPALKLRAPGDGDFSGEEQDEEAEEEQKEEDEQVDPTLRAAASDAFQRQWRDGGLDDMLSEMITEELSPQPAAVAAPVALSSTVPEDACPCAARDSIRDALIEIIKDLEYRVFGNVLRPEYWAANCPVPQFSNGNVRTRFFLERHRGGDSLLLAIAKVCNNQPDEFEESAKQLMEFVRWSLAGFKVWDAAELSAAVTPVLFELAKGGFAEWGVIKYMIDVVLKVNETVEYDGRSLEAVLNPNKRFYLRNYVQDRKGDTSDKYDESNNRLRRTRVKYDSELFEKMRDDMHERPRLAKKKKAAAADPR